VRDGENLALSSSNLHHNNWHGEMWMGIGEYIHIAAITSNGLEPKIESKQKRS
jgi:hypothetical protein